MIGFTKIPLFHEFACVSLECRKRAGVHWQKKQVSCTPIEDSDPPVHSRSLIRVFDGRFLGSQGSNVSSGGKLRDSDQTVWTRWRY